MKTTTPAAVALASRQRDAAIRSYLFASAANSAERAELKEELRQATAYFTALSNRKLSA